MFISTWLLYAAYNIHLELGEAEELVNYHKDIFSFFLTGQTIDESPV